MNDGRLSDRSNSESLSGGAGVSLLENDKDLLGLLPADGAALGSGRYADRSAALGQVELVDFPGQIVRETHPLARLLALGLLNDGGGVRARFINDRGGLEAFEEELQLLGIELPALAAEELRLEFLSCHSAYSRR